MPEGSVPRLIAIIVLVIFSGFFSATETAYSCASRTKLRSLAGNGNKRAKKVLVLAEDKYDKLLSTVLVGNNIVNLSAATVAASFFALILKNTPSVDSGLVSTIVMTVFVLIFGEVTPKYVAKVYPEKFAMAFYPLVVFFFYLLYVFTFFFSGWKWLITKIFRIKSEDVVTEDEVMTVVEEAEEDGTLKSDETKLIRSVIEFDDLEVGDILVPRVNVVAVDVQTPMEEIRRVFDEEGYSRILVYKDTIDTVIGTIHEKDFFSAYLAGKKNVDGILQNAFYTTEHAKISNLLKQLQKKKVHIAVVLDEYGGTLGLVTLEDILEELVGEIWDEHDEEVNFFKKIDDEHYLVDGNAPLSDVFEFFGLKHEDENFDSNTVSGWVIEKLGEIPHAGVKIEFSGLEFEVMKSTVKRVLQVKVTVLHKEDEEDKDKDRDKDKDKEKDKE